jgi:hypothetical protein
MIGSSWTVVYDLIAHVAAEHADWGRQASAHATLPCAACASLAPFAHPCVNHNDTSSSHCGHDGSTALPHPPLQLLAPSADLRWSNSDCNYALRAVTRLCNHFQLSVSMTSCNRLNLWAHHPRRTQDAYKKGSRNATDLTERCIPAPPTSLLPLGSACSKPAPARDALEVPPAPPPADGSRRPDAGPGPATLTAAPAAGPEPPPLLLGGPLTGPTVLLAAASGVLMRGSSPPSEDAGKPEGCAALLLPLPPLPLRPPLVPSLPLPLGDAGAHPSAAAPPLAAGVSAGGEAGGGSCRAAAPT